MQKSSQLFEEAKDIIPGGVNSPVRAFNGVGGEPCFIEKADGQIGRASCRERVYAPV